MPLIKIYSIINTKDDAWLVTYSFDGMPDQCTIYDGYRPEYEEIRRHILELKGYF